MSNTLDSETCDRLQHRLKSAEQAVRKALEDAPQESPLRSATQELMDAHRDIREMIAASETGSDAAAKDPDKNAVVKAEIEIGREEHEMKADVKDVLKSIFMWRDDPVERANGG